MLCQAKMSQTPFFYFANRVVKTLTFKRYNMRKCQKLNRAFI